MKCTKSLWRTKRSECQLIIHPTARETLLWSHFLKNTRIFTNSTTKMKLFASLCVLATASITPVTAQSIIELAAADGKYGTLLSAVTNTPGVLDAVVEAFPVSKFQSELYIYCFFQDIARANYNISFIYEFSHLWTNR